MASLLAPAAAIQRYTIRNDYVLGAAPPGTELFRSHALDVPHARYERTRVTTGPGGLSSHHEYFDQGAGAWQAVGGAPTAVAQPSMRFSQNETFAIRNAGGQSQVAYLTATEIVDANNRLAGQNATVRIQELAGQLTTNAGTAMREATGVVDTALQAAQPDIGTLARADQRWLSSICHDFARYSAPTSAGDQGPWAPGSRKNRKAVPRPGQKYYFKSSSDVLVQMTLNEFDRALHKLAAIDAQLAQMGLGLGVADVLEQQGVRGLGNYRFLLPGWKDHSEAVISQDGPDTLTFANYNRQNELVGVMGIRIRQLARADANFKTALLNLRANRAGSLPATNKAITNTDITAMMVAVKDDLLNEIGNFDNHLQTILTDLIAAKSALQGELFYFDMFGPKKQSFHRKYKYAGSRGRTGKTRVLGTAS